MRYVSFISFCLVILLNGIAFGDIESHPFSVHDMLAMDRISGQQVSPDGQWIVFSLRKTDLDANKGRTDLWLVGTDGKNLRQLTKDPAGDSSPCWSPDSKKIYFLSSRSGSSQVWCMPVTGKDSDAQQVTQLALDVGSLIISPDGKKLAISLEVFPNSCITETAAKLKKIEENKASGMIFDRLFIRHWDTWCDGRRAHIFVVPATPGDGKPVDTMKGMDSDCPTKPFGGTEEYTFTPDSQGVVFSTGNAGKEEAWSTNFDLFFAPIDGSKTPTCLTEANKAWDSQPVFSNNGKTLAYLAMKRARFEADRFYIILRDWATGKERILAPNWDRSPSSIAWDQNDKTLYAIAANLGQSSIFAISVKTGQVRTLVKEGNATSLGFAGKRLIYGMDTLSSPVELYSIDKRGKRSKAITRINAKQCAAARMGEYEQFTFKGWNDDTVYCYILKPVDFDANKKYPVAFLIHGGPQGSFGNHFHYRWNPQAYAGRGYACVMVDFHGSTGYGQKFLDAISGDWGGKPLIDLQKGLAAALEKYPWMDGEKVGALGASYGAYMINWIAGNWPDRFRCLVSHDGNLDEQMAYYDTEELWFPEWEHKGTPWDNPKGYDEHNPINHVHKWKTPMLVIHGALDYRVVDTQGISTFTALQRRGIPSKLLYFPDENHWVLKPHNSILWHDTVLDWLDQWCK